MLLCTADVTHMLSSYSRYNARGLRHKFEHAEYHEHFFYKACRDRVGQALRGQVPLKRKHSPERHLVHQQPLLNSM